MSKCGVKSQPNFKQLCDILNELEELYGVGNVTISVHIHDKDKSRTKKQAKKISHEIACNTSQDIEGPRMGTTSLGEQFYWYKIRKGMTSKLEFTVIYHINT